MVVPGIGSGSWHCCNAAGLIRRMNCACCLMSGGWLIATIGMSGTLLLTRFRCGAL